MSGAKQGSAILPALVCLGVFLLPAVAQDQVVRPAVAPWLNVLREPQPSERTGYASGLSSGFPLVLGPDRVLMLYNPAGKNEVHGAISSNGGKSWGDAGTIEENPDPRVKVGRPVAVKGRDGTLWVFYYGWVRYTKDPKTSQNDLWVIHSADDGRTWSGRRKIWSGYAGMLQGAIETSSGTLVLPFCYLAEPTRFVDGLAYSRDKGKSWTFVPAVIDVPPTEDAPRRAQGLNGGALEPAITQLPDGRLWMLTRTITGKLWQSYSADDGKTWTRAAASYMTCGGVLHMARLQSGLIVLVWNQADWSADWSHHFPWNFRELSIAFTEDGIRWQQPLVVARGPDEVHSFVAEVAPGKIMITLPKNGMLVGASEQVLRNSQRLVAYDSPSGFFKYGSHPFAPQSWSQWFFYDHANDLIPAPSEDPRVVFMGDSITDFWHLERSFPQRDFINRGISGQITPQMLLRFMPDVIALKPKVVVILGGTNDVARGEDESAPNTPTQMTKDSIRAMTELAQKNGIAVVLCSLPPVSDYSGVNRTRERPAAAIRDLNDWLRAYAREAHTAFADYFAALRDERSMLRSDFSRDGVHPNDAGYAAMEPVVNAAIEEALSHR